MRIAADLALVLAGLALLVALGLALPALALGPAELASGRARAQAIAMAGAVGLLVNHAAGLLFDDLRAVLVACSVVALAGLGWAAARSGLLRTLFRLGWARWLVALAILLLFCGPILFEPLHAWDARSIWFFQAKRIYFDGGLKIPGGWPNVAYGFSHIDYPKLLPLLAAQFAQALGVWNEYVPKASLMALLAPLVFGLLGAMRQVSAGLVLLALALLLGGRELLWNGYTDAYLAAYAGVSLIYFGRWLAQREPLDLSCGIVFAGVMLNLKNEGTLFAACVGAGLVALAPVTRRAVRAGRLPAAVWLSLLLALTGFGVWTAIKFHWGAQSDLQLGLGTVARISERISDGTLGVVAVSLLWQPGLVTAFAVFVLMALLTSATGRRPGAAACFPALVAALYALGIFAIYLGTPHDLRWHLATSADRTLLVAMCGFFASAFLMLADLELTQGQAVARPAGEMELQA